MKRTSDNPRSARGRSGRGGAQATRLREALARRRLEELREERLLRQHIGEVFLDEAT